MEGQPKEQELVFTKLNSIKLISETAVYDAFLAFNGIDSTSPLRKVKQAGKDYETRILQEIIEGKYLKPNDKSEFEVTYLKGLRLVLDQAEIRGIPISKTKIAKALASNGYSSRDDIVGRIKPICLAFSLSLLSENDTKQIKASIHNILNGARFSTLTIIEKFELELRVRRLVPDIFTIDEFDALTRIFIKRYHISQIRPDTITNAAVNDVKYFLKLLEKGKEFGVIGQKSIEAAKSVISNVIIDGFIVNKGWLSNNVLYIAIENGILSEDDKTSIRSSVFSELVGFTVRHQKTLKRLAKEKGKDKDKIVKTIAGIKTSLLDLASTVESVLESLGPTDIPEDLRTETSKLLGLYTVEVLKTRRRKKTTSQ